MCTLSTTGNTCCLFQNDHRGDRSLPGCFSEGGRHGDRNQRYTHTVDTLLSVAQLLSSCSVFLCDSQQIKINVFSLSFSSQCDLSLFLFLL